MSLPRLVAVDPASPAARAGLQPGDEIVAMNGQTPRDVIQFRLLADEPVLDVDVARGGLSLTLTVEKEAGELLGAEVESALFDRVRTCDNHCEFCFIYQLPPNLRKSLYLKDDDYRLSFLYGNFTTLTRFTEADLERVVTEGLSPLYVSIHATDPDVRTRMLRNRRGGVSLRWLRLLLDHGVTVHGQVVVCPGINDGAVLHDTLAGVLDEYPGLASVAVVPLGVSRFNAEAAMRPHTRDEAVAVVEAVAEWQDAFVQAVGRRVVFAADEYYLLAGVEFPAAEAYEGFALHEDGIGMARAFELALSGDDDAALAPQSGFFAWADAGYRAERVPAGTVTLRPSRQAPPAVVTGAFGARVLRPLLPDVRIVEVENRFFGGNIGVTGLLVGEDIGRALADEPTGHRYLLPDVCLSQGRFLDGTTPADLPRPVEIVPTDGMSLRQALGRA